jgi:glucose-6-phosphate 1-dehydrogenase
MTTADLARTAADPTTTGGAQPADVLVVFGITGDLAKQMTFRSLYRLECRGLPTARSSASRSTLTVADLRERGRRSRPRGDRRRRDVRRFAARLSYISGDFGDAETFERLAAAIHDAHAPPSTSRSRPSSSATSSRPLRGSTHGARVVVEKPFATT